MLSHLRPLLLAAAACVLAGDLAAQTQTVEPSVVRRLRDQGVTIRVGAAGVDTMTARTGAVRVRQGEMIVNVTGQRARRVQPAGIELRPNLAPSYVPSSPPDAGATPETRPAEPAEPARTEPTRPSRTSREEALRRERERARREAAERARRDSVERARAEAARREAAAREEASKEEKAEPRENTESSEATLPGPAAGTEDVAYALGYEIGMGDEDGDDFHVLVPIVEIEGGGLRYDPAQQAYVGTILFGLVDREHPAETGALSNQVMLQISGEVQSQGAVTLSQINIPFKQILLRVQQPRADSVLVRIRPTFDPTGGSVISIPILRAPFAIRASPRRIAGFGLEITELMVQARGDSVPVIISSDRAKPNPAQLRATRDGVMSRIRSSGVGEDTIRVASGDLEELVVIRYAWPIAFLLAALFGGLIGGVLNALSTKRHSDLKTMAFLAAQGALTGGVGAVLYAVGINVVGWAPSAEYGEGLMFAVAFICGLMGPRIFDRFLPKLSVGRKDGEDEGDDSPPPSGPPAGQAAPATPEAPQTPEPAAVG